MLKRGSPKTIFIIILLIAVVVSSYYAYKYIKSYNSSPTESIPEFAFQEEKNYPSIDELKNVPISYKYTSLIAVGDFLLDRNVGNRMKEINDYFFPIRNTKDVLESADITFCNVECPICEGRKIGITETSFRADPETVQTLLYGGFDIVSLANNHTMNFGEDCLLKTFNYLNEAGIDYIGAGSNFEDSHKPLIKTINGTTLAFLAYNDSDVVPSYYFADKDSAGTNKMDIAQLQSDIEKINQGNFGSIDHIILSMHSGTEYTKVPNQRQKDFAHAAIDAGVDIVLGHHPHNVQHVEQYKGKYIIYSMGNFVLDQMRWEDCTKELLLNITISRKSIFEVEVIPIRMKKFCETNVAEGYEKQEILEIINYETVSRPYIKFEENEYKIFERDVLENNDLEFDTKKTILNNRSLSWTESENLTATLYKNVLYVMNDESIIWSLDEKISDIEVGDFNNDDLEELVISYWEEEQNQLINKISMFKLINHEVTEVWNRQTADTPIIDIEISDLDNDGLNEMILIEGNYDDYQNNQYNGKSVMIWQLKNDKLSTIFNETVCSIDHMWIDRSMIYLICNESE